MNRALATSILTIAAAQLLKVPISYAKTGVWSSLEALKSGGMPSSHSASVSALASYIGLKYGFRTIPSIASMLAVIVMFDAMGIRRHAGLIAAEVNDLGETIEQLTEKHPPVTHPNKFVNLEERLGHLPIEVLGGALLGIAAGAISRYTEPRPNLGIRMYKTLQTRLT